MEDRPVAVVTGGTKKLGAAIARALNDRGYLVYITSRRDISDLGWIPEWAIMLKGDPGKEDDAQRIVQEVRDRSDRLDVLIENASSYHVGSLMDMGEDDFKVAIEGCIYPVHFMARAAVPMMRERGDARIVIMGLEGTCTAKAYSKIAAHAAAKAAIAVLARSMSKELQGSGISVSMVSPGMIDADDEAATGRVVDAVLKSLEEGPGSFHEIEVR